MATPAPVPMTTPPDVSATSSIFAATLTVTTIAFLTTVGRIWVRASMMHKIGCDDYAMIATMVLALAGQVIIIADVQLGAGRHMMYIPPADIPKALELNFVSQCLYVVAITAAKFSIGLFLLRIMSAAWYKRLIWGMIVLMWAFTTSAVLALVLQCSDIHAMWDPTVQAHCFAPNTLRALSYTNSAFSIFSDLFFALFIPILVVRKVMMTQRDKTKILIISSMSLGLLATAASIIKATYIYSFGKQGDWLWDSQYLTIWTVVECNVAITAGNLPPLRQFFNTVFSSHHSTTHSTTHHSSLHNRHRTHSRSSSARTLTPGMQEAYSAKNGKRRSQSFGGGGMVVEMEMVGREWSRMDGRDDEDGRGSREKMEEGRKEVRVLGMV